MFREIPAFSSTSFALLACIQFAGPSAWAWYGPLCYSDKVTQITLTQPTITGEAPGEVKVSFDDNDDRVKLVAVRPSIHVKNAHEVVLQRDQDSNTGNFAVILTSANSNQSLKYEIEIRKNAEDCKGAIVRVSEKTLPAASSAFNESRSPEQPVLAKPKRRRVPIVETNTHPPEAGKPDLPKPAVNPPASDAEFAKGMAPSAPLINEILPLLPAPPTLQVDVSQAAPAPALQEDTSALVPAQTRPTPGLVETAVPGKVESAEKPVSSEKPPLPTPKTSPAAKLPDSPPSQPAVQASAQPVLQPTP